MSGPAPDGSSPDRPVAVQEFRPGVAAKGLRVVLLWLAAGGLLRAAGDGSMAADGPDVPLALGAVVAVLTLGVVLRSRLTGVRICGGAVVVRTLSWPDVDRLRASVESELGVRFPDRRTSPWFRPRRRRGDVRW